jgi:hypothetical protein
MINYSVCNYLKISKINPNLIYNKSLYLSFTDSEEGSIDNPDNDLDNDMDNDMDNDSENDYTTMSSNDNTKLESHKLESKSDIFDYDCDIDLDDLDSNSFDEYDESIYKNKNTLNEKNKSKNSLYLSDSDVDNDIDNDNNDINHMKREIEKEREREMKYSYSVSSLESIQVNEDESESSNENIILKSQPSKTLNDIDECNECNEWTFINDDDYIVKKYKMEHKMQYLKYYYSMLSKDNPNMCINPINIYNDNSTSENKTYYF